MVKSPGLNNLSGRPTSVERGALALIGCGLFIVTDLPSLSAANRISTTFETPQVIMAESSSRPKSQVSFQTISKGNRSGVREFLQSVVRNQREWETLWQRHTAAETNPSPPPAVDFNKEIAIAIFLGEKPTGGYAVEITLIERKDGALVIDYKELNPAPGGMVTQALTQPFHMVRVAAKGAGAVSFRRIV